MTTFIPVIRVLLIVTVPVAAINLPLSVIETLTGVPD
jgi:hypothetical protein